jgi:hypothetical protein
MKIILLCGWAGAGKDATASILVKNYNYKRYAFADQLKDICSEVYGFPRELADSQEGKKTLWPCGYEKKTIRDLLLLVGKVERERFGHDIYVRGIIEKLKKLPDDSKIVISDLRYPYELAQMKMFGRNYQYDVEVWRIHRKDQVDTTVKDESEHYMEGFRYDRIVTNSGTSMEDLEQEVHTLVERIKTESSEECIIM